MRRKIILSAELKKKANALIYFHYHFWTGSAIIIHGHVVHKSEKNTSDRSREIYTYHIAESHNSIWCPENW